MHICDKFCIWTPRDTYLLRPTKTLILQSHESCMFHAINNGLYIQHRFKACAMHVGL